MITRRIVVNLVVFFALSLGLVAYGAVTLFGNPFEERRTLVADLPDAGGLRTGFSASHDGVVIGTVSKIDLRGGGVRVTVELDPGTTVASGVEARVVRASAVGEQRLDLASTGNRPGPALADGAVVPVADDPIPPDVADVLDTTNQLLDALPPDDLNVVVHELAVGVDGRSSDVRSINRSLADISEDVIEVEPDLRAVLDDGPAVLDDFSEMSPAAHRALRNTDVLTRTLASRDEDLVALMRDAGDLSETFDRVLLDDRASLTCLIGDVSTITHDLQGQPLEDLDQALALNELFFGAIDKVAVRGDAADVGYGAAQDDALWLRARLLIPPESPSGSRYSPPRGPRAVETGAGCRNDYGAGASSVAAPDLDAEAASTASGASGASADRTEAPSDGRPGFPAGAPTDTSPAAEDRPFPLDTFLLVLVAAAIAAAAAKFVTTIRNRGSAP